MLVGILLIVYAVFVMGIMIWLNCAIPSMPISAFPDWLFILIASYLFALSVLWIIQGSIAIPLIGLLLARSFFSIATGIVSLCHQES